MSQLLAVEFKADGPRYTYHNDGPDVALGDRVLIDLRGREKTVKVVGFPDETPPFETKPIIGLAPLEDEENSHAE